MEKHELENREICAKCGGRCCKISGCMYFVTDFESMKLDYLESVLDTGRISIKAELSFERLSNGKIIVSPILYLVSRNINRDVIDLVSFTNTCASLEKDGCYFSFKDRPSGGVQHVPRENLECYSTFKAHDEIEKFLPYQKVLQRIVKRRTGMSVNEKIKEDVEALFLKIMLKDYSDVPFEERDAFKAVWGILIEVFPEQFKKAFVEFKKTTNVLQRKNNKFLK